MSMLELQQNRRIHAWKLHKEIGRGGQGVVWKVGHEQKHSPPAALKICTSPDDKARARFARESQMLKECSHPGVVAVRDTGEFEECPYLVMELAEFSAKDLFLGESTFARLIGLSVELILDIFRQACMGVAYLHGRGLVHRDIKPSNILIMGAAGQPLSACIADFGIAVPEALQGELTETQEVLGTRIYRAREVEIGGPATPASDVYSLGRTLEFLVSGREPSELTPRKVLQTETLTRALCDRLNLVLARSCSHEPNDRYRSASEFADALPQLQMGVRGEWGGVYTAHGKLSAGDETIKISGQYRDSKGHMSYWGKNVSWNAIMEAIGPLILWEPKSEDYIMSQLAQRVSGYGATSAPSLRLQDRERVKYQLRELQLVKYEKAKTTQGGYAWFWSLTERGKALGEQAVRVLSTSED